MKVAKHPNTRSLGWALLQAARLHRFYLGERLAELGLFPGQEQVLKAVSTSEAISITDLAEMVRVRLPTVSKTVVRLEAIKLVSRATSQADGRVVTLALTDAGRAAVARIDDLWTEIEADMVRDLEPKERKRLRRGLQQVAKNLTDAIGADERRFDAPEDAAVQELEAHDV